MRRRSTTRPAAVKRLRERSTVTLRTPHSTLPSEKPPLRRKAPKLVPRVRVPQPTLRPPKTSRPPKQQVARVMEDAESTLLDMIDNLLSKGVMLNADLILALANVDLVYIRLSALLCAADRVLPPRRR